LRVGLGVAVGEGVGVGEEIGIIVGDGVGEGDASVQPDMSRKRKTMTRETQRFPCVII
jgi:hypothetical protein